MTTTNRFSPVLVGGALLATVGGILSGARQYADRSHVPEHHSSGTSAWTAHLILTAVGLAWLGATAVLARRRGETLTAVLTAPLRERAASRLRSAGRSSRIAPVALLLLFIGYNLWRAGEQIIGGCDPNFTANAWGGPSYLGAMYCHYLDLAELTAAAAVLLARFALPAAARTDRRLRPASITVAGDR